MKTKLFFLGLVAVFATSHAQETVLMEINGKPVTKSEFEYIYNKNNTNNSLDKKTLNEYVELFVNFKLKVEEAKSQGIDTSQSFVNELKGYRATLTKPYLNDDAADNAAALDAYKRMLEDVDVSHILISVPENATAADTLVAWEKINAAWKRVTGESSARNRKKVAVEDFEKVAREVSNDNSVAENSGHIGWISAFRAVYPFENVAYATPAGAISKPFRSPFGYHIVKVNARRKSQGEVRVAIILTRTAQGNDSLNAASKTKIDSLYTRIKAGDDFGTLAAKYSEDPGTARSNGELPWFGTGGIPIIEQIAFALENNGDVSAPEQLAIGWCVIKLLEKREIADFETLKPDIERNLQRNAQYDERAGAGKKSFIEKTKNAAAYSVNNANVAEFWTLLEGKTLNDSTYLATISKLDKPLFTLAGKTYSQADFAKYLKTGSDTYKVIPSEIIAEKFTEFSDERVMEYADSQLENQYPDFRFLIQEYHDGILLFEVNNREVWDKASKDTDGLARYFAQNKAKYVWEKPHFKGRIIYCKDEATFKVAKNIVKKSIPDSIDKVLRTRLNDSIQYVKIEKGLYVEGENQAVDAFGFKLKNAKYETIEEFPFVFAVGKILKNPQDYTDVRGQVTTDYQDFLESEWVKTLREKYPVKINRDALKTIKEN
ncbi:MAG: peptidylprolyl isomerase [Paludibacter sp.]|nr:peptidylprolyl isomerase [Paludibacter sp.]